MGTGTWGVPSQSEIFKILFPLQVKYIVLLSNHCTEPNGVLVTIVGQLQR